MTDPLDSLQKMPLKERIAAVAKDVRTNRDIFRKIRAHVLAEALGVPQPEQPSGEGWSFGRFLERRGVEEYAENIGSSDTGELLHGKISEKRYNVLSTKFVEQDEADHPAYDFLTAKERKLLEDAIWEDQCKRCESDDGDVLAFYSIDISSDESLDFEALIEDDGCCIHLKSPYDLRDEPPSNMEEVDQW